MKDYKPYFLTFATEEARTDYEVCNEALYGPLRPSDGYARVKQPSESMSSTDPGARHFDGSAVLRNSQGEDLSQPVPCSFSVGMATEVAPLHTAILSLLIEDPVVLHVERETAWPEARIVFLDESGQELLWQLVEQSVHVGETVTVQTGPS